MKDEKPESKFFADGITDRERAVFEAAITLGAVFHQYIGAPFKNKERIEKAIEESALAQPYVEDVEIKLNTQAKSTKNTFEYDVVSGKILEIEITVEYGVAVAVVGINWVPELNYPLMYIKKITD